MSRVKGGEREKQWKQQQQRVARLIARPRVDSCTSDSPLLHFSLSFQVTFSPRCIFVKLFLLIFYFFFGSYVLFRQKQTEKNICMRYFLCFSLQWYVLRVGCYKANCISFGTRSVTLQQFVLLWRKQFDLAPQRVVCFEFFFSPSSSSLKTPAAPQPPLMPPLLLSVTLSPPFCPVYGHLSCQSHEPHLQRARFHLPHWLFTASIYFLFFIITCSSWAISWPQLRAKSQWKCFKWGLRGEFSLFSIS